MLDSSKKSIHGCLDRLDYIYWRELVKRFVKSATAHHFSSNWWRAETCYLTNGGKYLLYDPQPGSEQELQTADQKADTGHDRIAECRAETNHDKNDADS